MNKRMWLGSIASLVALTVASGSVAAQQPSKPNIVVMLTDNLGYGELGVYGGGILRGAPTPRIDALAGEGMRLLNFNVEAECTPSRSAFMTGRFAIRSGTYAVPIGGEPDGLTTVGDHHCAAVVGAGLRNGYVGQMASWQRRSSDAHKSGV